MSDRAALIARVDAASEMTRALFMDVVTAIMPDPPMAFALRITVLCDAEAWEQAALALVEAKMAHHPHMTISRRAIKSGERGWMHDVEITIPSREFQGLHSLETHATLSALLRAIQQDGA